MSVDPTASTTTPVAAKPALTRPIRIQEPASDIYVDLLLQEVEDVAQRFNPDRRHQQLQSKSSQERAADHPIAGPSWSETELDLFFHSIARHSKLRPDLIAKDVGTKTVPQVSLYIRALEQGVSDVNAVELELAVSGALSKAQPTSAQAFSLAGREAPSPRTDEAQRAEGSVEIRSDPHAALSQPVAPAPDQSDAGGPESEDRAAKFRDEQPVREAAHTIPAPIALASRMQPSSFFVNIPGSRNDARKAVWLLRQRRLELLPAATEMSSDWIEFEEAEAKALVDRAAATTERFSSVRENVRRMPSATSSGVRAPMAPPDGRPASFLGDCSEPPRAEVGPVMRARLLYSASLPTPYDDQVAAMVLYLRHYKKLDPGRTPNVLLTGGDPDLPLRAFKPRQALAALLTADAKVTKTYAAFCTSHPAVPIESQEDGFRALARAIELGYMIALSVKKDESVASDGMPDANGGKRRRKLAQLYDVDGSDLPRSTGTKCLLALSCRRVYLCWADAFESIPVSARSEDSPTPTRAVLAQSAGRARRLLQQARLEARARLLQSLSVADLRRAHSSEETTTHQQTQTASSRTPDATGNAAASPTADTSQRDEAPNEASGSARRSMNGAADLAQNDGSEMHSIALNGTEQILNGIASSQSTSRIFSKDRYIFKGIDMGVDLSKMTPDVVRSVKHRIERRYSARGMEAALEYASRIGKDGQLTSVKPRSSKGTDKSITIVKGVNMDLDLSGVPQADRIRIMNRLRKRMQTRGVDDAQALASELREHLAQGLSYSLMRKRQQPDARGGERHEQDSDASSQEEGQNDAHDQVKAPQDLDDKLSWRRNRIGQIGLHDPKSSITGVSSPNSGARESLALLSPELERAVETMPAVLSMLRKRFKIAYAQDDDGAALFEAYSAEAAVAEDPRRISSDALASLWLHLRSFVAEIVFSVATMLEPYSLNRRKNLPVVKPMVVRAAIARLGYPQALPGIAKQARQKSKQAELLPSTDWEALATDEIARTAMQIDPPVAYHELFRDHGVPKEDDELLNVGHKVSDVSENGSDLSDAESTEGIAVRARDAHLVSRPRAPPSRTATARQTAPFGPVSSDESATDRVSSDGDISDIGSSDADEGLEDRMTSPAVQQSQGEEDGSDDGWDAADEEEEASRSLHLSTKLSEVDTSTIVDSALRASITRAASIQAAVKRPTEAFGAHVVKLLALVEKEQRKSELLELDMLDELDELDNQQSLLEAEEMMKLIRGWDKMPSAGGEADSEGGQRGSAPAGPNVKERSIERMVKTTRHPHRRAPRFMRLRAGLLDENGGGSALGATGSNAREGSAAFANGQSATSLGKRRALDDDAQPPMPAGSAPALLADVDGNGDGDDAAASPLEIPPPPQRRRLG